MAEAPLALRIAPRKPRTLVGESIVLDVTHEIRERLKMETVHLNRNRTELLVSAVDGDRSATRRLTGEDYVALHRHRPLTSVGTSFVAEPGSAWTSQLDLFRFTRPLAAGRYRIELAYRWGAAATDVVRTAPAEIEVLAATLGTAEFRWLGGAGARDRLSALCTVQRDGRLHWTYQVAAAHDPSVIDTAADLDMPDVQALTAPRPAHLNDIASMHFERYVVWREAAGMGRVKVHARGRSADPAALSFALAAEPAARLADPPLQARAGALHAIWIGADAAGRPAASWIVDDGQGNAKQRTFPLDDAAPLAAVVGWGRNEEPVTATLFVVEPCDSGRVRVRGVRLPDGEQRMLYECAGELVDFFVDQWAGAGAVYLVVRAPPRREDEREAFPRLEIVRWSFEDGGVSKASSSALPPGLGTSPLAQWRHATPLPDGNGLALLFEGAEGWTAWSNDASAAIPRPEGAVVQSPRLVSTPRDGVYFVFHEAARAFSALPVFSRPASLR